MDESKTPKSKSIPKEKTLKENPPKEVTKVVEEQKPFVPYWRY